MTWRLQEAKNRLSEVVALAESTGPQEIAKHGRKAAVVLSYAEYVKLKRRRGSLADFFTRSPLRGVRLERQRDPPRGVKL